MRSQQSSLKFTFLDPKKISTTYFKKIRHTILKKIIKEDLNIIMKQKLSEKYKDKLETPMFQLEVSHHNNKVNIFKTINDLHQLKNQLPSKFGNQLLPIPFKEQFHQDNHDETSFEAVLDFFVIFLNHAVKIQGLQFEKVFEIFIYNSIPHSKSKEYLIQEKMKVYYQLPAKKRAGGRHNESNMKKFLDFLTSWQNKFVTISSQGIYYTDSPENHQVKQSILFGTTFNFLYGEAATGYPFGVILNSSQRVLQIDTGNLFSLTLFVYFLRLAINDNENLHPTRYSSFAGVKQQCEAKFYIDGQGYFADMYDALMQAKSSVYILGWMVSPHFSLKRPDPKGQYKVDYVLQKISKSGIKVYILIYNGPKVALNIDSEYSETHLMKLSKNITVLRHPNYVLIPFLWSHHQKMVVIDQSLGFMGGLDIGYGRMDSNFHRLNDETAQIWDGVDYCNYRKSDILDPQNYKTSSIDRQKLARMPWHDIALKLKGNSVQDLCRHFIQYWNYVNFQMNMDDRQLLVYAGLKDSQIKKKTQENKEKQEEEIKQKQKQVKKVKQQKRQEDNFQSLMKSAENQDLSIMKRYRSGKRYSQEQDLVLTKKAFSQYLTVMPQKQQLTHKSSQMILLDQQQTSEEERNSELEFYAQNIKDEDKLKKIMNMLNPRALIFNRQASNFQELVSLKQKPITTSNEPNPKKYQFHQILRSASMWSLGLSQKQTQKSIQNAYLSLIEESEQYIYIQNQFFISVDNEVTNYLVQRIKRAFKEKKKFKVMIMLPALPGFDGEVDDGNAAVFRVQVHLTYHNVKQMYRKLKHISNVKDYLLVFCLRTHGVVNKQPQTQIIYVHSKMMLVDDRFTLIGSANINDRSLKGTRDTELAILIEDKNKQTIEITKNKQNTKRTVSPSTHELRKQLYRQHFDLTHKEVVDYLDDDIWDKIYEVSKKNMDIYRDIFGCYPDSKMTSFAKMKQIQKKADIQLYDKMAFLIKGHAIPFQIKFLCEEDLSLGPSQKEYFLPAINFH